MQRRTEAIWGINLIKGLKDSQRIKDLNVTSLASDVIHVMRKVTLQEIVTKTRDPEE